MELPLSYVVVSEGRRCGSASAVHGPSPVGPPYRASSIAPKSSTSRVRLHRRTRLGTATASLRPRPDRRVTRRLCRRGSPRPGEAGRRHVESRATALATALRSRGRARPAQPHRRRTRIQ